MHVPRSHSQCAFSNSKRVALTQHSSTLRALATETRGWPPTVSLRHTHCIRWWGSHAMVHDIVY